MIKHDYVIDWLSIIVDQIIPPYCVEIVLKDGCHHYLHSVNVVDNETKAMVLRIWDFRAFNENDFEQLKIKLNTITSRADLSKEQEVHPKLDWANLRIHFDQIAYCIEWHDRLWPEEERPQIGFKRDKTQKGGIT